MGTQSGFPIQTVLTRKVPLGDEYDVVVVVGGGNQVAIQPVSFGETITKGGNELRAEYAAEVPEGASINAPTYMTPGPSPEEQFADWAAEDGRPYDPKAEVPKVPTKEELAALEEHERVMAERAAEELARTNTIVTEVQQQPQVGQASHESEPVVKPEEPEATKEDSVEVTTKPSPARRGAAKKKTNASSKA